jgi:hypothetical protein
MATPSENGDYVATESFTVWYDEKQDQIHLTTNDADFTHAGTGPGMRVVFSRNPKSANFHPSNFNRCRDILIAYGKSAPPEAADETVSRRIDKRTVSTGDSPAVEVHHVAGGDFIVLSGDVYQLVGVDNPVTGSPMTVADFHFLLTN